MPALPVDPATLTRALIRARLRALSIARREALRTARADKAA